VLPPLIGVILLVAAGSCSQAASAALPTELREHLEVDRFFTVTSVRGLPLGVRGALQSLFASQNFDVQRDIAEPEARFQGTGDIKSASLPLRRLIAAECSMDHCLVYYERGGSALTYHLALFQWTPDATRLESGGQLSQRLPVIEDARKALLAGAFQPSPKFW
jgi:hypothetical protein